ALSGPVEYFFDETSGNPGGTDSGWQTDPNYTDDGLSQNTLYTYKVQMRDRSDDRNKTGFSAEVSATTDPDISVPMPNPATFASGPSADNETEISMTATTGTDISGPIEYLFTETTGNPGATSSGWRTDSYYEDIGLSQNTEYTYTVQMRDNADDRNYTAVSNPASVFTDRDVDPPDPNLPTLRSAPLATDSSIRLEATIGTDITGPVEYLFTETSGNPGASSRDWSIDPNYTDTGLTPDTEYIYTIQMRDSADNRNYTGTKAILTRTKPDRTAPDPYPGTPEIEPAAFATGPDPESATSIIMEAVIGSDLTEDVHYRFVNTTLGHNSGWDRSNRYTDTGLSPDTEYCYTVQMRDAVVSPGPNVGTVSVQACATTDSDEDPPEPLKAAFDVPPAPVPGLHNSDSKITMTATIGNDVLGNGPVE
ncbi:hypothetical protein LCGC14_2751510, partial [marine sediment metagenome]